jgi:hypothetical protein
LALVDCRQQSNAVARDTQIPSARKAHFVSRINVIRPVQSQKYPAFSFFPNQLHLPRIPPHAEGRFVIVTNEEAGSSGREISQHSF